MTQHTQLIVCLGEALVDRLGLPGQDLASDGPVDDRLGGAPANVACGLARLGTPAAFVGRLGTDPIGVAFFKVFEQRGINVGCLQEDPERPSRVVLVRRELGGERQFHGFAGDKGFGFADQALTAQVLPDARWLLIGTIPLASPTSAFALHSALKQMEASRTPVALDVNWRPTFWDEFLDPGSGPTAEQLDLVCPLLQQASLIKLAREEALWFFATDSPVDISRMLPQHPDVVVTNGGESVHWCLAGECGIQPAFQLQTVVDTTGAGDAFTAGLLHRWDAPPSERVLFAAACGAIVCTGAGAIDSQPTEADVDLFLRQQNH